MNVDGDDDINNNVVADDDYGNIAIDDGDIDGHNDNINNVVDDDNIFVDLGAGYGDGPKHETSETSETKSKTKIIRNTAPYHKSPVAATPVLNGFIKLPKNHKHAKLCPTDLKLDVLINLLDSAPLITDGWLRYIYSRGFPDLREVAIKVLFKPTSAGAPERN